MPLCRADLPRLAESVHNLVRVILDPRVETLRQHGVCDTDDLPADCLPTIVVHRAIGSVLEHLMPSGMNINPDTPPIDVTRSDLDLAVKVVLKELRRRLLVPFVEVQIVRSETEETVAYLEDVHRQLIEEKTAPKTPAKGKRPPRDAVSKMPLIAAELTRHHHYATDRLVTTPAKVRHLARALGLSPDTVSRFFAGDFERGHTQYTKLCADEPALRRYLDHLNGNLRLPDSITYGRRPPGEGRDDV